MAEAPGHIYYPPGGRWAVFGAGFHPVRVWQNLHAGTAEEPRRAAAPIVYWPHTGSTTPAIAREFAAAILAACDLDEAWARDTGKAPGDGS